MSEPVMMTGCDPIKLTGDVVAAYVSKNHVAPVDLPALITRVHGAILALRDGGSVMGAEPAGKPGPVQIRRSIRADSITSFLDGKPYKTLKRHLAAHGLTPTSYRETFGLAPDYPMVAPDYSARRSSLAKALGLGVPGAQAKRQKTRRKAS